MCGQRVWKRQPGGGFIALGTSPARMMRWRCAPGSGRGMADSSACVYGCSGAAYKVRLSAVSTSLPRYITATRSLMCLTTARSWAMNRYDSPKRFCRFCSRLTTCAWIETSSADTGSSQTIRSGLTASARAMPMRWRWPPEN
jgi:hypothetical protein